jgi:AcrR family transcriptional regulator
MATERSSSSRGGRPLGFSPDAAIDKALPVFWQHGYDATSHTLLESATGLSRSSLLNTFGQKEDVFVRVLDRYRALTDATLLRPLREAPDGRLAIERFFRTLADFKRRAPGRFGCVVVTTASAGCEGSSRIQRHVDGYYDDLRSAFADALARTHATEANTLAMRADVLTSLAIAVNWTARARGPAAAARVADSARALAASWFPA